MEKLVRLQHVLVRQKVFVEAGRREAEYASVIDPLLKAVKEQSERLTINSARVASFLRKAAPDEAQRTALAAIIQRVIDVVLALHEVLILLPRETAEPQVFLVLQNCFGDEWRDTPVIMTNALTSYEYRIEDILDELDIGQHALEEWRRLLKGFTRGGSILAQAFIDRDNPLAWAVLAHEYGHALDKTISRQIVYGDQVVEQKAVERDPKVKWTAEVFADFVAARVLGPSSQIPILLLEMSRPLARGSHEAQSHPPTSLRLELVRAYLKQLNVNVSDFEDVFSVYEFDYAQKLALLDREEREKKNKLREVVGEFLRSNFAVIASKVDSLGLRPFGNQQLEHSKALQKKLQADLPISCRRESENTDILKRLNLLAVSRPTRDQVYDVLSEFNETPAVSSEILTAGWLYKLASFEDRLKESFPKLGSQNEGGLEIYGRYLTRVDELLLKSLELAAIRTENQAVV